MPPPDRTKLLAKVRQLPTGPGVYLMKDRFGSVLYVGKAKDLKRRVSSYFQASRRKVLQQPKVTAMIPLIYDLEVVEVKNESEALLLEGKLIKEWKPRYNTDFVDDKRFLLVRVDVENPLPRFRLARFRQNESSRYFGPFAHAKLLRRTLGEMRLKFGILLGDAAPLRRPDGTWQLYDDARAELYGHGNLVTEEAYRERVEAACVFLQGKSREWLEELEEEMAQAAEEQRYERAAELRDLVLALRKTTGPMRRFTRGPGVRSSGAEEALTSLREALALPHPPHGIECFDISHISGTYVVASMVRFQEGLPDKSQYRRYKIKSFTGNDDFRAMEEVVGRRYRRLNDEGQGFPDLVLIDGGIGQVGAAVRAFLAQGLAVPPLVGLAKREETIVFPDGREPLRLPGDHPGRLLLQRVRDEAHRFANTYNADLRTQRMRQSVLDDFPGLGKVRREALLQHFRSLERLRLATPEQLREVPGIGPKLAAQLAEFLAVAR